MDYIIFDLELNSKFMKSKLPNEIIEIGAVRLNSELETTGLFQSFVLPKIHKKLLPIIKRKTGIIQSEISRAASFRTVVARFRQWLGNDYLLCCWGHDDIHHFITNCELNRLSSVWLKRNVDIQQQLSALYNLPAGHRFSLKNALNVLEIPIKDDLHRADADARYTAEIFKKAYNSLDLAAVTPLCRKL
jgi:inhibitor of KinA sporulation pathway (predicted exonuclease)